jgi:cobalt-zinc-cadmium resistance protein CzcA
MYWARQQVQERLQLVQDNIPAGIGKPELGPISTGLGEIFQYVVRAKKGTKMYTMKRSSEPFRIGW